MHVAYLCLVAYQAPGVSGSSVSSLVARGKHRSYVHPQIASRLLVAVWRVPEEYSRAVVVLLLRIVLVALSPSRVPVHGLTVAVVPGPPPCSLFVSLHTSIMFID